MYFLMFLSTLSGVDIITIPILQVRKQHREAEKLA